MSGNLCRRCLLEQTGEKDIYNAVLERIALIPDDLKADPELYSKRLEICGKCDHLYSGTCYKCGCYVQLRAAYKESRCPCSKRLW